MESRKMVLMNLSAGQQQRHRHREPAYGHGSRKEGEGEMNGESDTETYMLPQIKYIANGNLLYYSENSNQSSATS